MRAIVPKCIAAGRRRDEARLRVNEVGKSVKKAPPKRGTCGFQMRECLPTLGVVPIVNVFSDLILREAVALLEFAPS
jgi:hypothetical protein